MINVNRAKAYIGKPYVWGGESMNEGGFDCSGFVYNALRDSGYNVPRDTAQGYYKRYCLNRCDDKEGVLLFFGKSITNITHVAISLGDGTMLESIGGKKNNKNNPGKGVTISKITRRKDLVAICSVDIPNISPVNVSRETLIVPTPTLKRGSMGVEVDRLQKCLNRFGYGLVIDGKFGNLTYKALCDFQYKNGLRIDGIYGEHSRDKMRELIWK